MNNTEHGHKVIKNEKSGNEPIRCVAGCIAYTGGEVKHHKDCMFYEWSISECIDKILVASKCSTLYEVIDKLQPPTITDEDILIAFECANTHIVDKTSFIAGAKAVLSMMPQSEGWGDIDSIIEKFKDETGSSVFATHTFTNWLKSKYTLHSLPHQPKNK
jgi:hypothetical protein